MGSAVNPSVKKQEKLIGKSGTCLEDVMEVILSPKFEAYEIDPTSLATCSEEAIKQLRTTTPIHVSRNL
jgi:hypothetical protein